MGDSDVKLEVWSLVEGFFKANGDFDPAGKMALWMKVPNPLLGNMSPDDMIRLGRGEKLLRFVKSQLTLNDPPRPTCQRQGCTEPVCYPGAQYCGAACSEQRKEPKKSKEPKESGAAKSGALTWELALKIARGHLGLLTGDKWWGAKAIIDELEAAAALDVAIDAMASSVGTAPLYYIRDARQVVGNCALWWRAEGKGYTTELREAGKFTHEQAFKGKRDTDIPIPCEVVDDHVSTHVRLDRLAEYSRARGGSSK